MQVLRIYLIPLVREVFKIAISFVPVAKHVLHRHYVSSTYYNGVSLLHHSLTYL